MNYPFAGNPTGRCILVPSMPIPPWFWTWPGWAAIAAAIAGFGVVAGFVQLSLMRRQTRVQDQQRREDFERSQAPVLALEVRACHRDDGVYCFDCRLHADGGGTANYVQVNVEAVGDRCLQVAGGRTIPFIRAPGSESFELLVSGLRGYPLGESIRIAVQFMSRFRKVSETTYEGLFFAGVPGEAEPELRLIGPPQVRQIDFTSSKPPGHLARIRTAVWAWWMRRRGYVSMADLSRELARSVEPEVR